MQESTDEKAADFTILKTDSKAKKPLAGAKFTLQSPKETIELVTDSNGRASSHLQDLGEVARRGVR